MHYGKMSSQNATTSDVEMNFDHISKFEKFQLDSLVMIFFLLTMSKFMLKWNSNIKMKPNFKMKWILMLKCNPTCRNTNFHVKISFNITYSNFISVVNHQELLILAFHQPKVGLNHVKIIILLIYNG